jgi:hypothetical protein
LTFILKPFPFPHRHGPLCFCFIFSPRISVYGFYDECKRRCSVKVWKMFTDVFNCLPVAAIVGGKVPPTHFSSLFLISCFVFLLFRQDLLCPRRSVSIA